MGLAHRLDRGTCGLIAAYKSKLARASLARQFCEHSVVKKYVCLSASESSGCVCLNSSDACSFVRFSAIWFSFLRLSLLDCKLVVGKRHLIRLTQRHVCGDRLYCVNVRLFGLPACLINSLRCQCLSAYLICLRHFASSKLLVLERAPELSFRWVLINFLKLSALSL
ncbi:pseudouridine synthase, RluA family [Candidatus Hodgkinia cicadicola]|nr:pseudouridine synthase, RluA family [Candidatus Hodgkinia cicadicola]